MMVDLACYFLGIFVGALGGPFLLLPYANGVIRRAVNKEFINLEPIAKEAFDKGYQVGYAHGRETTRL